MSVYGFDDSLSKVETPQKTEYDALADRVTAIESYDQGSAGSLTPSTAVSLSAFDNGTVIKRGNLVAMAWTFDTLQNVPAYTTLASVANKYKPKVRHYFVGSAGKKFMVTTTGYLQNVDALATGTNHIIGTSYMGVD